MDTDDLASIVEKKKGAWTAEQLASLLECSNQQIYNMVQKGKLPAYRIGSLIRFDPKTTATWLRQRLTS